MLPLNDKRWKTLNHRGWSDGHPSPGDPDAPEVAHELAKLRKDPFDFERFRLLSPYLCSEGTAWAAAYAAVPHVVELAQRLPRELRVEHLVFVGHVVIDSHPERGPSFSIKRYLMKPYKASLITALPLLVETHKADHKATDTCYLLAAAAALKGHRKLGLVLTHLDCIYGECPRCGEAVYPDELQNLHE